MDKICPICNNLSFTKFKCSRCGGEMRAFERIQEFMGDYGENEEILDSPNCCVHLFKCDKCGHIDRKLIDKIWV